MWICCQMGAREHYAVPRALHEQGLLTGLVTDWYAFGQSRKQKVESSPVVYASHSTGQGVDVGFLNSAVRRLSSFVRHPSARAARAEGIPDELVHAFLFRSLLWKWQVRRIAKQGRLFEAYAETDAAFASAAARLQLPQHEIFFGYSYASLETLKVEKSRGVLTVLDQIDPGAVEFRIVAEEMKQHPEIAGLPLEFPAANFARNRHEWELADIIIVNSEWSREAIIAEGADPAKIEILPLAYEASVEKQPGKVTGQNLHRSRKAESREPQPSTSNSQLSSAPLRVLWLGQVNVRKGIHYLMRAARLLERENVQFDVVGPLGILPTAVAAAPKNMVFHGAVSRDRAAEWYRQSDVFVLPTLSDGFALTQLEAMAHSLPVIATPNCGRVVEDGNTGFIIPTRDPRALADAILRFVRNPELAREMAPVCRVAVKAYSYETLGRRLVGITTRHRRPAVWPLPSDL
jgi:glycosyltransferase involved in cell wall biosynthesis